MREIEKLVAFAVVAGLAFLGLGSSSPPDADTRAVAVRHRRAMEATAPGPVEHTPARTARLPAPVPPPAAVPAAETIPARAPIVNEDQSVPPPVALEAGDDRDGEDWPAY